MRKTTKFGSRNRQDQKNEGKDEGKDGGKDNKNQVNTLEADMDSALPMIPLP